MIFSFSQEVGGHNICSDWVHSRCLTMPLKTCHGVTVGITLLSSDNLLSMMGNAWQSSSSQIIVILAGELFLGVISRVKNANKISHGMQ